ncbi:hypothetical protein KUM39_08915 [Streptomyces sp. J2-1]|uniref:effector-associated constant component EACC1 n=1 Tax=Streptomyces corallincola TaxID=2851888 RepID=UPI001C384A28|nr:hypothetical protein [Streptomyces corallincola]MBV2354478.1 hypothetical protein [Streptomyces corallincola]
MTSIEIRVPGAADPEAELRSLLRWLTADEETGPRVRGRLAGSAPARPGSLGTYLDIISLVVSGGLSAGQLALAVDQWRAHRRAAPKVTLRRGPVEIEVTGADPEALRTLAELLADEERPGDGGTP